MELQKHHDSLTEGIMVPEAEEHRPGLRGSRALWPETGAQRQEEAAAAEQAQDRGGPALVPHANSLKQ